MPLGFVPLGFLPLGLLPLGLLPLGLLPPSGRRSLGRGSLGRGSLGRGSLCRGSLSRGSLGRGSLRMGSLSNIFVGSAFRTACVWLLDSWPIWEEVEAEPEGDFESSARTIVPTFEHLLLVTSAWWPLRAKLIDVCSMLVVLLLVFLNHF